MRWRWWLHILLLLLTFLTTTAFGYALTSSFAVSRPVADVFIERSYYRLLFGDHAIWAGTIYSVPVLFILMAHEMGHFVACQRWRVDATLPYFLPFPALGTLGAFIRISSPIYYRRSLFDIGISGPIAGFVALLPFLTAGVWMSKVVPPVHATGSLLFGTPLLLRGFEWIYFPGIPPDRILLHPVAMAAWVGLLATSINLLPASQLDGGHILYALGSERAHRITTLVGVAVMALLGRFYLAWLLWALLMFLFRRHPLIYDRASLGTGRLTVGALAVLLLILSFVVIPVEIV
jgi:membrane-associated protease RseP (regulator of RpoE activity)